MRIVISCLTVLLMVGCGSKRKKSSSDASDSSVPVVASGESADAVEVAAPVPGPAGQDGAQGAAGPSGATGSVGATGATGATGAPGGVMLYDGDDLAVGYKFSDENLGVARVLLLDRKHAFINLDTGNLSAPFGFFCTYESADCTGTCYVYDSRWWDMLVVDGGGVIHAAPRKSVNLGPKTIHSYTGDDFSCKVNTIAMPESYEAPVLQSLSVQFPLTLPLYWDLPK